MDGYELRKHISNITELLSEILAEVKGVRQHEAARRVESAKSTLVIDSLHNKFYEG